MRNISNLLILLISLVCISCIPREVSPSKIKLSLPKLVVSCLLSPQDTLLTLVLSESLPVLMNTETRIPIKNAEVCIVDENNTVHLSYMRTDSLQYAQKISKYVSYYQISAKQLKVLAGKTYTLSIKVPDGRQVRAKTTIPMPISGLKTNLKSLEDFKAPNFYKISYLLNLSWIDASSEENYYKAGMVAKGITDITYYLSSTFLTDKEINGKQINLSLEGNMYYINQTRHQVRSFLWNIDKNYFLYQQSIEKQNQENPFAEPVFIYSNIEGGLGCFGSYNAWKEE